MGKIETKKYLYDFFILKKKHFWFLIPTPILYYNKETFFETGVYTPSFGFTFRFLNIMIGIQIQKNLYIKNENKN
jgi:hypothetical protein